MTAQLNEGKLLLKRLLNFWSSSQDSKNKVLTQD